MPAPLPSEAVSTSAGSCLAVASATVSMVHLSLFKQAVGSVLFLPYFLPERHRRMKV